MITITRKLAVINGFVRIPNTNNSKETYLLPAAAEVAIPGSSVIQVVKESFLQLPTIDARSTTVSDYYATLNAL